MGSLRGRRIVQSRIWLDPNAGPPPPWQWDETFPITVYEAVRRGFDPNSSNLLDELQAIYRLINGKQDIIQPGTAGNIMTWTGVLGSIGSLAVVRAIQPNPEDRSHARIPTERAIGTMIDGRVPFSLFNAHVNNISIHITDVERTRWNSMAPMSSLTAHVNNQIVHITSAERMRWNAMTSREDFELHIYNTNNPHNVTAHQVGTYTREQIDEMFENLRQTFFTYLNIEYNEAWNQAELVQYHPANWNPNWVLPYPADGENLPDVPDPSLTYFALRPETDYRYNETNVCVIYVKRPGLLWQAVGFQEMNPGDLVIKFPDTSMFLWLSGRFVEILSRSAGGEWPGPGGVDTLWRPVVDLDTGYLTWVLSTDTENPPAPVRIVGEDGLSAFELAVQEGFDGTLQEWLDNLHGQDGEGVAPGGEQGEILTKLSAINFDTTWKSLMQHMTDLALAGTAAPENFVWWQFIGGDIKLSTIWYDDLGDSVDGFMTQRATTEMGAALSARIAELDELISPPNGIEQIRQDLYDHMNDTENPHNVTIDQIDGVSYAAFSLHVNNTNNPHAVTHVQVGLGNIPNLLPINWPLSQLAIDRFADHDQRITLINNIVDDLEFMTGAQWDNATGMLTFTFRTQGPLNIHIPIAEIFSNMWFDNNTMELVIELPTGFQHRINLNALIQIYVGSTGTHINVIIENDNIVRADIIPNSITGYEIRSSVHLRGSPTTFTQPVSDRSTRIATTQFVKGQVIDNLISFEIDRPLSANMGRVLNNTKASVEEVIQMIMDIEGVDVIDHLNSANPRAALSANMGRYLNLVKAPRVHTSPSGSTFGQANAALFGHTRASETDPTMDGHRVNPPRPWNSQLWTELGSGWTGEAWVGTDNGRYARADHAHPTDISRARADDPEFGGNPRRRNDPPLYSYDNSIPSTRWSQRVNALNMARSDTPAANQDKVGVLQNFVLPSHDLSNTEWQAGRMVVVHFIHGNTHATPRLRIDGRTGSPDSAGNQYPSSGGWPMRLGQEAVPTDMITPHFRGLFILQDNGVAITPRWTWQLLSGTGGGGGGNGGGDCSCLDMGSQPEIYEPPPTGVTYPMMSGFMGFTIDLAEGSIDENGEVDRVFISIPFKNRRHEIPLVNVSNNAADWAIRVGGRSGTANPPSLDINLTDPQVVVTTHDHCVVRFTLSRPYPSNSPCFLVHRRVQADIQILPPDA